MGSTILLLTGAPGIGKTTLVKRLAAQLAGRSIAGFYTEEMRANRHRVGFKLIGLAGESGVIAQVDFASPYRVGRYGVDVAAIDRLSESNLTLDGQIYLIDEIGKMECLSTVFVRRVEQLLGLGKTIVATVAKQGSGFIKQVKRWPGAILWEVTCGNRDELVERALAWLGQWRITP